MVDQIWEKHLAVLTGRGVDVSKVSEKDVFFMGAVSAIDLLKYKRRLFGGVTSKDLNSFSDLFREYLAENKDIYPPGETPA